MTIDDIRKLDPISMKDVEEIASSQAFDDLFVGIVSNDLGEFASRADDGSRAAPVRLGAGARPGRRIGGIAIVMGAVLLLALGLVLSGGHSPSPVTKSGRTVATRSFGPVSPSAMTWQLAGVVAGARWEQNSTGPPPGGLTCAAVSACYAIAGQYASPSGNAPLLGESFYASSDFGRTWSVFAMPKGFAQTSGLHCPSVQSCAVAGIENDKPVLVETNDGGQTWTTHAVDGDGAIQLLDCSASSDCSGVIDPGQLEPDLYLLRSNEAAAQEMIVSTTDGGATWSRNSFPTGHIVSALACPAAGHCLVIGTAYSATTAPSSTDTGFAMTTGDGGAHWQTGSLPAGTFTRGPAGISCADQHECMAVVSQDVPAAERSSASRRRRRHRLRRAGSLDAPHHRPWKARW